MYCSKCGNKLKDDSKFCDRCGASVNYKVDNATKEDHEKEKSEEKLRKKEEISKFNRTSFVTVLAVLMATIGICALIYVVDSGRAYHKGQYVVDYKGMKYAVSSDGTAILKSGDFQTQNAIIAENIEFMGKRHKVIGIGKQAFRGRKLTSVRIPDTVKEIGAEAF